jgi:hypothetical protein
MGEVITMIVSVFSFSKSFHFIGDEDRNNKKANLFTDGLSVFFDEFVRIFLSLFPITWWVFEKFVFDQ